MRFNVYGFAYSKRKYGQWVRREAFVKGKQLGDAHLGGSKACRQISSQDRRSLQPQEGAHFDAKVEGEHAGGVTHRLHLGGLRQLTNSHSKASILQAKWLGREISHKAKKAVPRSFASSTMLRQIFVRLQITNSIDKDHFILSRSCDWIGGRMCRSYCTKLCNKMKVLWHHQVF